MKEMIKQMGNDETDPLDEAIIKLKNQINYELEMNNKLKTEINRAKNILKESEILIYYPPSQTLCKELFKKIV